MNVAIKAETPRRRKRALDRRIMDLIGHEWCGNSCPPNGGHQSIRVEDDGVVRVFSTIDDGHFIGIGYPSEWQVIMRTRAARLFAWWVLRRWAADWFGLRSAIYYRALHHSLEGDWSRLGNPRRVRALTRPISVDSGIEIEERYCEIAAKRLAQEVLSFGDDRGRS